MLKCSNFLAFTQQLFDEEREARQAAQLIQAILKARSPRLTDIAEQMQGHPTANYKALQRFLRRVNPKDALRRLFQAKAPFVIGDPTEVPRPQARKTAYVGTLKDGKTRGFWLLLLATPFRGRAIPFSLVTYSSKTIAQEEMSRNRYHSRAFAVLKERIGERPLVLDREFSYLHLLLNLVAEEIHFVIRLNLGSHVPIFLDEQGKRLELTLSWGEERTLRDVFYQGQVRVHLMGQWRQGFREPLWVMTDLDPSTGWRIYQSRMKIDESFRDLKSLLGLGKIMNQQQAHMENMVALLMLAYAIGVLIGEALRDHLFGPEPSHTQQAPSGSATPPTRKRTRRSLYSGLFILLKMKPRLPAKTLSGIACSVAKAFVAPAPNPVRTHV